LDLDLVKKLVPGCGSTQTGTIGGVAGTAPAFAYSYARSIAYTWDATYGSLNGIGRNASRGGGEFAGWDRFLHWWINRLWVFICTWSWIKEISNWNWRA